MNITIFKRYTISGRIRGEQIAKYAGFKLNPEVGWENDACIYVKRWPRGGKKQYLDLVDHKPGVDYLKRHQYVKAIAISNVAFEYLSSKLKNEVVLIPQQHCNPNRIQRTRTEINTVGFCGCAARFGKFENEIRTKLNKIGMDLIVLYHFKFQQEIIDFYKKIDIQVVWRQPSDLENLKNPLKLSNAGSFGIPTVSRPEINFVSEYDGYFIPATSIDDLVDKIGQLRDEKLYKQWSDKVKIRAEDYHISKIVKNYLKLGEE